MTMAATGLARDTKERIEKTDDQLMMAYSRGDQQAFDALYSRFKQPIYQYLFRNSTDLSATDEMFQNVWLRLIASVGRYQNKGRFRAWIFTLAHNCLVDYYRASNKFKLKADEESVHIEETASIECSALEHLSAEQRTTVIADTLSLMPVLQKEAFYLRQESDFSIQEIADIQNVTPEAAKSRLRYAYSRLRKALEGEI